MSRDSGKLLTSVFSALASSCTGHQDINTVNINTSFRFEAGKPNIWHIRRCFVSLFLQRSDPTQFAM
jgi:hypothetical protein